MTKPAPGKSTSRGPAGTIHRYAEGSRAKLIRTSGARWSDEAEEIFIDALAATCNVTAAAEACGFTTEAIYRRRRRHADFAAKWDAAARQGYARIEMALVRTAADTLEGLEITDHPIPKMTVAEAMNLLKLHRATAGDGKGYRFGHHARPRPLEELREGILRKVEAIKAARGEA